jgi:hypothetical protein
MVHCSSDHNTQQNGKPYLTPTQRTTLLNKELKVTNLLNHHATLNNHWLLFAGKIEAGT